MEHMMEQALDEALRNWEAMSQASHEDDAEGIADEFQSSFYRFIDTVREWYLGLSPRPGTLEQLMALPQIEAVVDRLPAPLLLNFETEAELILDNVERVDEERYD